MKQYGNLIGGFGAILLLAAPAVTSAQAEEPSPPTASLPRIEEIIVTANRRAEDVQEMVGSVSVVGGDALERTDAGGFEDYVYRIPGVDLSDDGGSKKIAMRGISNMSVGFAYSNTTSPIAIYMNDTPIQGDGVLPDLDLYDLERIEVLKGPQGTLYGEGAQGGLMKMLLHKAEPGELRAKAEVGVGKTLNGGGLDNFQKAMVNVPVPGLDSWAVRLVGSRRWDSGYIDYFNIPAKHANDSSNLMGRVHLDGEFWDGFRLSSTVLHEGQRLGQFSQVQFAEGDLRNRDREPQFVDTDFSLASLTLDYDLDFATVTSSTSVYLNDRDFLARASTVKGLQAAVPLGGLIASAPNPVEREWVAGRSKQHGIAQELRLGSPGHSWVDWIAGFYFRTRASDSTGNTYDTTNENTPPPLGPGLVDFVYGKTWKQYALFGDVTLDLPWDLKLSLGARGAIEDVGFDGYVTMRSYFFPLAVANGYPDGRLPNTIIDSTTTAFTPKASLSWSADEGRMFYMNVASGVRSGGVNQDVTYDTSRAFPTFDEDTLWAYEIGAKTQWLDGLLTANLALFYNDWKDLQIQTTVQGTIVGVPIQDTRILNVGRAFSRGLELELAALPIDDLTLGFNIALSDGAISKGSQDGTIPDGSPLPQLAKLSYSALAGYTANRWPIFGFVPSIAVDLQTTGTRVASPPVYGFEYRLRGFQTVNAQLLFATERWEVGFGVKNITDARQELGINLLEEDTVTVGRPRSGFARLAFRF